MKNKKIKSIAFSAIVAALYVVLTLVSSAFGLSSGIIQIRISEALCALPLLNSAAIPGLFIGCLISNILNGANVLDVLLGSFATLLGALGTYLLKNKKLLALLSPVVTNAAIVPLVLLFGYSLRGSYIYFFVMVALGELLSCVGFGLLLLKIIKNSNLKL